MGQGHITGACGEVRGIKGLNSHFEIALYVDTFDEVDTEFRDVVNKGATSVLEPTTEPWGGSAPAILQTRKEILLISGRSADPFER